MHSKTSQKKKKYATKIVQWQVAGYQPDPPELDTQDLCGRKQEPTSISSSDFTPVMCMHVCTHTNKRIKTYFFLIESWGYDLVVENLLSEHTAVGSITKST